MTDIGVYFKMTNLAIDELNFANSEDQLIELSENEQKQILGGDCTYAGQGYSTGAIVPMGNDQKNYQCQSDGTWRAYDPAKVF
jgi:hypothetical protein